MEFFTTHLVFFQFFVAIIFLVTSTATIGTFVVIQKRTLASDAIAHALLPGLCIAFWLAGTKDYFILLTGAFVTGWLAMWTIETIPKHTKLSTDAATTIVLSVFFGIGILMLTFIQHQGNAEQHGLRDFLFGKAASLIRSDIYILCTIATLILLLLGVCFRGLYLISFDTDFAQAIGFKTQWLSFLLQILFVLSIVASIQVVGVTLVAAMLIAPPTAARFFTHRLSHTLGLSVLFGLIAGLGGGWLSYRFFSLPTGPCIVILATLITFLACFFSPKKGVFAKLFRQRRYRKKMLHENILKLFYELERKNDSRISFTLPTLLKARYFKQKELTKGLKQLKKKSLIQKKSNNEFQLTSQGRATGARILKLHELWEFYLLEYLKIKPDHVHEDAEAMEHIISGSLEKELEKLMAKKKENV